MKEETCIDDDAFRSSFPGDTLSNSFDLVGFFFLSKQNQSKVEFDSICAGNMVYEFKWDSAESDRRDRAYDFKLDNYPMMTNRMPFIKCCFLNVIW